MNTISIKLDEIKHAFLPGEEIKGAITWSCEEISGSVEVRLFWYTSGKGTSDMEVISVRTFQYPGKMGSEKFAFTLPRAPYSFSGQLISLTWAIEAVIDDLELSDRSEFIVSPTQREIDITGNVEGKK